MIFSEIAAGTVLPRGLLDVAGALEELLGFELVEVSESDSSSSDEESRTLRP